MSSLQRNEARDRFNLLNETSIQTVARTEALLAGHALNRSLRRILVDARDELHCRQTVRQRYGAA